MRFLLCILIVGACIFLSCRCLWAQKPSAPPASQVHRAEWAKNAVIYELNTRQFTPEGTFRAVIPRIDELKKLGVDIIWFMPIHPIGEKNRKGPLGSPYSVRDYYGVSPELGTLADFREVVTIIHEKGMHVIIDLVANHTAWDNPLTEEHPEWFVRDREGKMVPPVPDWEDVVKLDYSNEELRRYMCGVMEYWVRDVGIDGFRCDVAAMVPVSFWDEARPRLDRIRPVFMLAEAESPELLLKAFDCDYGSEYFLAFNAIAEKKETPAAIDRLLAKDRERYPTGSRRMLFITNHDQNSWRESEITRYGREGSEAFAVLTFTLPGMPLIYNGQEIASEKKLAFFQKDPIEWKESSIRSLYQKLCSLKKKYPALSRGTMERIALPESQNVYAFVRALKGSDSLLVMVNLSQEPAEVTLPEKYRSGTGIFPESSGTPQKKVALRPWGFAIYRLKQPPACIDFFHLR